MCHQVRSVTKAADCLGTHATLAPAHREIIHKRGSRAVVYSALYFLVFLQQSAAHFAGRGQLDAQYLEHASLRQDAVSTTHVCGSADERSSGIDNAPAALCNAHSGLLP